MENRQMIDEIKIQKLLSSYKKLEPSLISCQTHEDASIIIREHEKMLGDFFSVIISQTESGNFSMHYQPQIQNGKCSSAEALFRCSINNTPINPQGVFALADHFNCEHILNNHILNKICSDIKLFHDKISPNFHISYNISPKLVTEDFSKNFYSTLSQNNVDSSTIGIELLESSSFKTLNPHLIQNFINSNTTVALDDFGTGYSNKGLLETIPITHLKFAGELISNIQNNQDNQQIVSSALETCQQRDIIPIFEKVSTQEEYDYIMSISNNTATIQGYYFSKPLEPNSLIEYANNLNQSNELEQAEN